MRLPDASVRIPIRQGLPLCGVLVRDNERSLSPWSRSRSKRLFDISIVLAFTPVILLVLLATGLSVRLTSRGPVIFRQMRVGPFGRTFTILKFRTMFHTDVPRQNVAASAGAEQITRLGRLLRWLKLDELPQVINVLWGEMSLVGPRPRVPEQQIGTFTCRPGITSPATLAFAREDLLLVRVPAHMVAEFYMKNLLPAKQRLDDEYIARATWLSDLVLLVRTFLRRWDSPGIVQRYGLDAHGMEWVSAAYQRADVPDAQQVS